MQFLFEYKDEQGEWQLLGTGNGAGANAVLDAFNDLADDEMAAGPYRYRPDDDATERWGFLRLTPEGQIALTDEP